MKPTILFLLSFSFLISYQSKAQLPAPSNDMISFKKQDSINPPPQHAILFVGSSSFTKWTDVQSYFPSYQIINRGFGGSTLLDVIKYAGYVILPYNPKQIVIYCGENDIAYSDTVTAPTVLGRFKTLFDIIRKKWHNENVVFISIKTSPSRAKFRPVVEQSNVLIKTFLASQKKTSFVDVFHLMLNSDGKPKPDIFLGDSLHMKPAGYAIWKKAIEPYLAK